MIPDKQQPYKTLRKKRKRSNKYKGIFLIIYLITIGICGAYYLMNHIDDNSKSSRDSSNVIEMPLNTVESNIYTEGNVNTTSKSQESYSLLSNQIEEMSSYFYYGDHSYKLYRLYDITGRDVINYCDSIDGYLAHINDSLENEYLASTISSLGYDVVYFGYSDEQSEGDWYWIDEESSSYVNWRSGEPNNEFGEEHYALILPDGTWNDGKLERDSQNGVIILCEWDTLFESAVSAAYITDYRSHISSITSSSHLANETYGSKTYIYSAEKAFDNDLSTCWSEGVDGYGVGESITVSFDDEYEISELSLWNGLCTNEDLFYKNSRLHNITVVLSNGSQYDFECSDGWDNRNNSFSFGESIETSSITITIRSVYEGSKYKDTCISEISVS